jgi:hypothetical protein
MTAVRALAAVAIVASSFHFLGAPPAQDQACRAPTLPERFPPRGDSLLATAPLGFTLENAQGRYELIVSVDEKISSSPTVMELARLSAADSVWAREVRKSFRAPTLFGASDQLRGVRLPTINGYVIMGRDGKLAIQADVTSKGALVFALGDHLYDTSTKFETTQRDGPKAWRGWWWSPIDHPPGGHGYLCLRKP